MNKNHGLLTQKEIPSLNLRHLLLQSFRCHVEYKVDFNSGINIIIGDNGSGKTTLLEAVQLMANGTSFRRTRMRDLVHWQKDRYLVRGDWHRYGLMNVQANGNRKSVVIALQGRQIGSRKDLDEYLAVVTESPQSDQLMDGVPKIRRHWLDRLMLATNPLIRTHYQHYGRALLQRARLLRQQASDAMCEPWNQQLVQSGRAWIEARQQVIDHLNALLEQEVLWLDATLSVMLRTSVPDTNAAWLELLRQQQQTTKPLKIGPHCDLLALLRDGHELRTHGSHGQQRVASVTLRLVECHLRAQARHLYPVLMLDDCFDALDPYWRQALLSRVEQYPGQILITVPDGWMCKARQADNSLIRLTTGDIKVPPFSDRCNGVDGL
ncbi:MAG: DNA replication and repair protein RecF [Mariprofundales bacterium]